MEGLNVTFDLMKPNTPTPFPFGTTHPMFPDVSLYHLIASVYRLDVNKEPIQLLGSCFKVGVVGDYAIYLTAAHLFGEIWIDAKRALRADFAEERVIKGSTESFRIGIGLCPPLRQDPSEDKLLFAYPYRAQFSAKHDVGVIVIYCPQQPRIMLPIATSPVQVGEQLSAWGYPRSSNALRSEDGMLVGESRLVRTEAAVTSYLPTGRYGDEGRASFPCFESGHDCSEEAVSGGPVTRKDSSVVGIISIGERTGDYTVSQSLPDWLDEEFLALSSTNGSSEKASLRRLAELKCVWLVG